MLDSDYYPAGAYNDPNAPYNEPVYPDRTFDFEASQLFIRSGSFKSSNYYLDSDGDLDISDADFINMFNENHYTVSDLLGILKKLAKEKEEYYKKSKNPIDEHRWKFIQDECDAWELDEEIIEQS